MSRSQFFFQCLNATIPLTSTLGNEYPFSNETNKKNGTVRGDCIACDALFPELSLLPLLIWSTDNFIKSSVSTP